MSTYLNPRLRAQVKADAENRPGIYQIFGPGGELLYVGKSVRVRTRLLSYFRAEPGEKAAEIIREARDVRLEYIPDEFGTLVREMRLIQKHRPRYNVQHKRKRAFAFVKITSEPAPRILPVSTVSPDGATYFGPFPRVGQVARTIRDLAHVMGLRDCAAATPMHFADQLDLFGSAAAHARVPGCMRAELGSCTAPCAGGIDLAGYRERVEEARWFLEGQSWEPLRRLDQAMVTAARRLDFEYAAIQRDRLERMRRFQEDLAAYRGEVEGLRFVYAVDGHGGARRLYLVRSGRIVDTLPGPDSPSDRRKAATRIRRSFAGPGGGPAGLTPEQAAEILLVARWFRLHPEEREKTVAPEALLQELGQALPASRPPVPVASEGTVPRRFPQSA